MSYSGAEGLSCNTTAGHTSSYQVQLKKYTQSTQLVIDG